MLIQKFKTLKFHSKVLVFPTIAILLFGTVGYFLGELCGSCLGEWRFRSSFSIINSLLFDKYLLWLILSVGVGVLLYLGLDYFCKQDGWRKWICVTLAVVLTIWNIIVTVLCLAISIDSDDHTTIHEGGDTSWYVSRSEEICRLQSKSVWFGRGKHYYTYPECLVYEKNSEADKMMFEVTDIEQTRAYFAFGSWRSEELLPVLVYCFGKWIGLLYFTLVFLWLNGSFAGFVTLKGRGRKILYGSCMSLVGTQLILTMLDYYGIVCWEMPIVFSTADWTLMIPVVTIQLTVMFFLITDNQRNYVHVTDG